MTTSMTTTAPVRPSPAPTPLILTRVARHHVEALGRDDITSRLLIVGTAGSGKTRLLRRLAAQLEDLGRTVVHATTAAEVASATVDDVVLVDDAHLLDEGIVASLSERLRIPGAGAVLATRPWPVSDPVRQLMQDLEQAQPPIVLGHVTRTDVAAQLDEDGRRIDARCIDSILDLTGQLTWLVWEALAIHTDGRCDDDVDHSTTREELRDLIAHRVAGLDGEVRAAVEAVCLSPNSLLPDDDDAQWALAGHAHGLLQRNGQPAPVVRDTVRATTPVDRLVDLYAAGAGVLAHDPLLHGLVGELRDPRVATALLMEGDAALPRDPRRAAQLYRAAGDAGAAAANVAVRRAGAEWAAGDIDTAGALLDAVALEPSHTAFAAATAVSGAIWAARADMATSAAVFERGVDGTPDSIAHATIAAVASADTGLLERLDTAPAGRTLPSTLVVAHELLTRGLRATLTPDPYLCLSDLVRATEMYTASSHAGPAPELPAVIAAVSAISLGDLGVASSVIDSAVDQRHGGQWARPRLLLWQAWIEVQRERPHQAEAAARKARACGAFAPRERLLADAITVALTRRYADASALGPVWRTARESILRARFDLFSLLPLAEFAVSAARLGDLDGVRPHLDQAYAAVERLGMPPMWSAPLHWAGLHCSILSNHQDELAPHARALLAAAPHSPLAKMMAAAGRVWTDVLTGTVDADAVEHACIGLATVGLAWDGARLASQGAARSEDRRVIARLLACARQLHPREQLSQGDPEADTPESSASPVIRTSDQLSAREREVAVLVLQGKTYAEIGASIFISPRTAEHHIARIRRRLGATSRSDLIAKLRLLMADADDADGATPPQRRTFA